MKEQQTPYSIRHVPAHRGPGRYDEHWTLDAMGSGHGLTTHQTREAAQARADELFGPTPLATITIKVFADRTQVHAVAAKGIEPRKMLDQAIAALRAEIGDLDGCPFHTPSQGLDAATVERAAQVALPSNGGCARQNEHAIRSEIAAAIRALATDQHQHGGKGA